MYTSKPILLPATGVSGTAGLLTYAHTALSWLVLLFLILALTTIVSELRHRRADR